MGSVYNFCARQCAVSSLKHTRVVTNATKGEGLLVDSRHFLQFLRACSNHVIVVFFAIFGTSLMRQPLYAEKIDPAAEIGENRGKKLISSENRRNFFCVNDSIWVYRISMPTLARQNRVQMPFQWTNRPCASRYHHLQQSTRGRHMHPLRCV